jgi:outer membrane protein assembly factor BamD
MPSLRILLLSLCLLFVLGAAACGGSAASSLNYGDNARLAYSEALDDFYDDDCIEAAPAMSNVRRQFPYTRFAALAELRIADCLYKDGKYPEAIQAYETFIRYRPSHVEVPYARFMVAQANYDQIPSEWLLSPATYEREQRFTQESLRLLRRFILDFPDDPMLPRAKHMAERAVRLLAAHELYVAGFYLDRDYPHAAIGRLHLLINTYPGSGYEPKAWLMLGETFLDLKDPDAARKSFERLAKEFPNSEQAAAARDHLASLGS